MRRERGGRGGGGGSPSRIWGRPARVGERQRKSVSDGCLLVIMSRLELGKYDEKAKGRKTGRTSFHTSNPFGTPSLAFHPVLTQPLTFLLASSNTPSILSPAISNQGKTIVCNGGYSPRLQAEGDQSERVERTFGRMSWSRRLSRMKEGRRGDQAV